MPRCIQCNEPYAAGLRRCPHCGVAVEVEKGFKVDDLLDIGRNPLEKSGGRRGLSRRFLLVLGALAALGVGAAVVIPGQADPDAEPATASSAPRQLATTPARPKPPRGIQPGPLEQAVSVEQAALIGDQVLVRGALAPASVTRLTLDGEPVPVSADGRTFQAILPRGKTSFELVAHGLSGDTVSSNVLVSVAGEGAALERVELAHRLDGQTYHERLPAIEYAPGAGVPEQPIALDSVETIVRDRNRLVRLYRAPEGLVFLRVTRSGHYSFLRERDGQEVILVPAGIAKRGMGTEPPHGPQHVVKMSAYLMDRTEVTGAQYAAFLEFMDRVGDPSLRHREDPGSDLRPAGWNSNACPAGREDQPVVGVSWYGAFAYARWVGGRLPTEAQWECAAAGADGRRFPWGREYEIRRCVVDADGPIAAHSMPRGAGPADLLHAAGNAREWTADRFDPRWLRFSARVDPVGPAGHRHRVVRGGSFAADTERLILQFRDHLAPDARERDVGFRVAMSWPAEIR